MELIKQGSKGESVRLLQRKLGITVDGQFGDMTLKAVVQFQMSHGLKPDGIVGNSTWLALGEIVPASKAVDASIIYLPLTVHITPSKNRSIDYLVIHFTAGSNSKAGKARSCKSTFESHSASADFAVDDKDLVQFNPDPLNYYCWAVGGGNYHNRGARLFGKATNRNCISIEICSTCTPSTAKAVATANHSGWSFTPATLDNARKLARILMQKYSIDKAHVIRHYDVTGKLCPGIPGWNDEPLFDTSGMKTGHRSTSAEWEAFLSDL